MKREKQGVSLIVLVITIIIMIILAAAVILALNNSNIIERADDAVTKTDMAQIQQLASIAWTEAYADGKKTQTELKTAVMDSLKANGYTDATLNNYVIDVTTEKVTVRELLPNESPVPADWANNVTSIIDTVPIPKGFVASQATGENTKAGGLVIYEGTESVTDANVETAKRTRNQYVWVPVAKDTFDTKFIRTNHNFWHPMYGTTYTINKTTLASDYWEVLPTTEATEDNLKYTTTDTLAEVQAMYESVKEYGGFYIARYEAGLDMKDRKTSDDGVIIKDIHSKMNKAPYTYVRWTYDNVMDEDTNGAVEVARSIYPDDESNTTGVISTLTYGVQWDSMVTWVDSLNIADVDASMCVGNYTFSYIGLEYFNEGAQYSTDIGANYNIVTTDKKSEWLLTTGATEWARVNNIYDMAGNVWEWTMEGYSTDSHVYRGGSYALIDAECPPASRSQSFDSYGDIGFRPSLYIKK